MLSRLNQIPRSRLLPTAMSTLALAEEILAPDIALVIKETANKLYSAKDFSGAAAKYTAILDQFSHTSTISPLFIRVIRCNRAACLIELGRHQDAIPDLQEVIHIKARATSREDQAVTHKAHFRLACCFCELGRFAEAVDEMKTYRQLVGGQPKQEETRLYTKILSGLVPQDPLPPLARSMPPPLAPATRTVPIHTHSTTTGQHNLQQVRYEVRVFNVEYPIVKHDVVPMTLCSSHPPEVQTKMFLANLVTKYHDELVKSRSWNCWNCPARAVSLVHTPASYLHLQDAHVIDFAQPVCVNGGWCENAARTMMDEEMRLVATQGKIV
ncbi:hypothetical protein BJ912DRAFT_439814 [Pholiota molesta]|nr:hypothetical protein BJ912DRAFT_439814 [Pholiota molesta]